MPKQSMYAPGGWFNLQGWLDSLKIEEKQLLKNKEKFEREIDKAQYKIETIQKTIEEISSIKE